MTPITLLNSAARTTTTTSADMVVNGGSGVFVFDITAVPGVQTVTLTIQGKDETSGKYYTLIAGTALSATSTNVYKVGQGLPVTANVSANDVIPRTIRAVVTHSGAGSFTYTVGGQVTDRV